MLGLGWPVSNEDLLIVVSIVLDFPKRIQNTVGGFALVIPITFQYPQIRSGRFLYNTQEWHTTKLQTTTNKQKHRTHFGSLHIFANSTPNPHQ